MKLLDEVSVLVKTGLQFLISSFLFIPRHCSATPIQSNP